ncbi:MAG: NosD domain-containing protein [Methanobacteriota archaeon]
MKKNAIFNKGVVILVGTLFLITSVIPALALKEKLLNNNFSPRTIIIVDDEGDGNYRTIHDAIAAAHIGDIINVYSGSYQEQNLLIQKNISLIGISHEYGTGDDTGKPVVINENRIYSKVFIIEWNQVTVSGFEITMDREDEDNTTVAILISSSNSVTISNNLIEDHFYGVHLVDSNTCTITNNEILNNRYGLVLSGLTTLGSSHNQILNNYIHSNKRRGIYFEKGNDNFMRNNNLTSNKLNFGVSGTLNQHFIHTIDISNFVESKPIRYFVNQHDIQVPTDAGYIGLVNCRNILVQDVTTFSNQEGLLLVNTTDSQIIHFTTTYNINGVSLFDSTHNTIRNSTLTENEKGIYLDSSDDNTIQENMITNNMNGITIFGSSNTLVTNNKLISNNYGIIGNGENNDITGNIFKFNVFDISEFSNNIFSSNVFSHNLQGRMIGFGEVDRMKTLNNQIELTFILLSPDRSPYNGDNFQITSSPIESMLIQHVENRVTVHFNVTQLGTYSVRIMMTDTAENTAERIILFFVEASGVETTSYYLRAVEPTHGQPLNKVGTDAYSFLFSPPLQPEYERCGMWVQNSPDELPALYPLSILRDITVSSWYKFHSAPGFMGIALQRYVTYNQYNGRHINITLEPQLYYTWTVVNFTDINWSMDYAWSWYWCSIKLSGGGPFWRTIPEQPSTADFTYTYTTTPTIVSLSDPQILLLSATSPADNLTRATIAVEGTGTATLVVQMPDPTLYYKVVLDGAEDPENCSYTQDEGRLALRLRLTGEHSIGIEKVDNHPPFIPNTPAPPDFGRNINVYSNLNWEGGDPDENDIVRYTVYFKARSDQFMPEDMISENQTETTFNLSRYLLDGHMDGRTKYFWQITSLDRYGVRSVGPIWCFKTGEVYEQYPGEEPIFP